MNLKAGGQVGLGALSDARGFAPGYVVGGAITVLALPVLFALRKLGGAADAITGDEATDCTIPAGLPREAHVEAHHAAVLVEAD